MLLPLALAAAAFFGLRMLAGASFMVALLVALAVAGAIWWMRRKGAETTPPATGTGA